MPQKTKTDSYSSKITEYYLNNGKDHKGRSLIQVLNYFDSALESSHDIVQYVFPLKETSKFFRGAPILTEEDIEILKNDEKAKSNMLTAFHRYMKFYGILVGQHAGMITDLHKADNWESRKRDWVKPNNHNHLRLSRIIKSLKLFGLTDEAEELYIFLIDLSSTLEGKCFSPETIKFWKEAVES